MPQATYHLINPWSEMMAEEIKLKVSTVTPAEAADVIRDEFTHEPLEPGFLHRVKFAERVCESLGVAVTPWDSAKVMRLLEKHNIDGSAYEAFPGWFENSRGEKAICDTEEIMEAFMNRPDPATSEDAGSIDAESKFVTGRTLTKEPA
jgi:hypothetical protein